MHRAHQRDAVHSQKFFFRKNLYSPAPGHACAPAPAPPAAPQQHNALNGLPTHINGFINGKSHARDASFSTCSSHTASPRSHSPVQGQHANAKDIEFGPVEDEYGEFTINEIVNGDGQGFPGLMGVVRKYLDGLDIDPSVRNELDKSLDLIRRRADGSLVTTATWMRQFVQSHPDYKHDSVVSERINYDLVKAVDEIERGVRNEPTLLPSCYQGSGVKKEGDKFDECCGDALKLEERVEVGANVTGGIGEGFE